MKASVNLPAIAFLSLIVITHSIFGAEVYRWVDENGNVHYSDTPESDNAVQIPISDQKSNVDTARLRKRQRLLDVMDEERQQKSKEREDILSSATERKQKCDQITKRLQQILDSSFLYEDTGDPLNPRILSSEEKNSAIENARKEVRYWCGTN